MFCSFLNMRTAVSSPFDPSSASICFHFETFIFLFFYFSPITRCQVFAKNMEKAVIETVEAGHMTKDLAICVHGWGVTEDQYLMTEAFMDEIKVCMFVCVYLSMGTVPDG